MEDDSSSSGVSELRRRQRPRQVRLGQRTVVDFPSPHLQPLLWSDLTSCPPSHLRERMATHGYLFVPGLLPRSKVLKAREAIVAHLKTRGVLRSSTGSEPLTPPQDERHAGTSGTSASTPSRTSMADDAPDVVKMEGFGGISLHSDVKSLLECNELFEFFRDVVFGGHGHGDDNAVRTFDYKWIRAVGQNQFTGVHSNAVYMSRGSTSLHTVWMPLGDTAVDHGSLAVIDKSHALESYDPIRQTYGQLDVDRDKTEGWLSRDPLEITENFGGVWQTADFEAGDVLIFSMQTLHCSTTNMRRSYRLSCDVRFQPAKDPVDERWVLASDDDAPGTGKKQGTGHTSHGKTKLRSMEDARNEWGI